MRDTETIIVNLDQQPFENFDLAAKMRDLLINESEHHYRVDLFDKGNESAGFVIKRIPKQLKSKSTNLDIKKSRKHKQVNQRNQRTTCSKINFNKSYHPALRTYLLYIPLATIGLFLVFFCA